MIYQFSRTELIFGKDAMRKIFDTKVAVFGIGGVGGFAVEALARSGVGRLDLFDDDKISITNLNRQIHATRKTIGEYKVDAAKKRILEINPDAEVNTFKVFYVPATSQQVELSQYDYIVDAIDTVSGKIELAVRAYELGIPAISSMGAGNKVETTLFEVADIYSTSVCPLAKVIRHELRKRGIPGLKVVYSKEPALAPSEGALAEEAAAEGALAGEAAAGGALAEDALNGLSPRGLANASRQKRQVPGSNAFVPAVAGLIIAGEVVKDLTGVRTDNRR